MDGTATWATALVTGATGGIGLATARALARVERLLVHGPEVETAVAPVLADLEARLADGSTLRYLRGDFRSLAEVAYLAAEVHEVGAGVELLVNNAGIPGPARREVSADGNELTLQVDYLAPVALAARLAEGRGGHGRLRILNVASATHLSATLDLDDLDLDRGYSPVAAYARSKLALVIHTCWLGEHAPPGVEAVSVHPGVIGTELLHAMFAVGGDGPDRAAEAILTVAGRHGDAGAYYDETRLSEPHPSARDPEVQRRLHELTAARLAAADLTAGSGPGDRG